MPQALLNDSIDLSGGLLHILNIQRQHINRRSARVDLQVERQVERQVDLNTIKVLPRGIEEGSCDATQRVASHLFSLRSVPSSSHLQVQHLLHLFRLFIVFISPPS